MAKQQQQQERKVYLSERWTKVAAALPSGIQFYSNHPALSVEPSGFRRVVTDSLATCEEFLDILQKIEDHIEERIPGLTSYYSLNIVRSEQPRSYVNSDYGGYAMQVSGNVMLAASPQSLDVSKKASTVAVAAEQPSSIIERHGNAIIYGGRKLDDAELISFEKGMNILKKVSALRNSAAECIATFGALDAVLGVGKVYSTAEKTVYFGEHALTTKEVTEDLIPLTQYWGTLSAVHRMRSVLKKVKPMVDEKK